MNIYYKDILSRIAQPPLWFDEYAVPRFEPFTPDQCADIYARECALLRVECQACERSFSACVSYGSKELLDGRRTLSEEVLTRSIGFGDPPNVDCCPAGPTMSSNTVRVIEFWRHNVRHEWERVSALEIVIDDSGA